jgi:hypothetical protein
MAFAFKLTHDEPRLVYLALVYHLGRPGSELDVATRQPSEHGLRNVKLALGGELDAPEAIVELDAEQYRKLLSAIYGCVNELRVYHMRGGAESTVPRFAETARALFPAVASDPEAALDVSQAMMMLHRRMERAVRRAADEQAGAAPPGGRFRWPFRR